MSTLKNDQFRLVWFEGTEPFDGVTHLRLAIDGTLITAGPLEDTRRFEVIADRAECEGIAARRFACRRRTRAVWLGSVDDG